MLWRRRAPLVVVFPDSQLEQAIRSKISRPQGDIYQADLIDLTNLSARYQYISNLEGLEYCLSLTYLDLTGNEICDIGPLVDNPGLGEGDKIYLHYNPLSEICLNDQIPALEARGVMVTY